jgi:hypothetical protein
MALCHEALKCAYLNPNVTGAITAPTYRMLADITRTAFLEILEENRIPFDLYKSDNAVDLHEPNSRILFRSLDQPERLRGLNLGWFACDELSYAKEQSFDRLLGRLRHPKARFKSAFAVWTPNGHDWVWRRFIGPERIHAAIYAKPFENKHVNPDEYYGRLKLAYDERFYRQEVLGEYLATFGGQAYYTFDRTLSLRKMEFDPRHPLLWALDFNIDPACSVYGQIVDESTREDKLSGRGREILRVLGELVLPDTRTIEHAERFLTVIKPYLAQGLQQIRVYGDATGDNRQRTSLKTDWQQVKDTMRANLSIPISYRIPTSNPSVRGRIATVNGMIRNSAGERRLFVDHSCKELINDFEQVAWKRDAHGTALDELAKKDPKRTHLSDALGYMVWQECRPHQPGPQSDPLFRSVR